MVDRQSDADKKLSKKFMSRMGTASMPQSVGAAMQAAGAAPRTKQNKIAEEMSRAYNKKRLLKGKKTKTKSDKERIAVLEKQLATLIARTQQQTANIPERPRPLSDVDRERAIAKRLKPSQPARPNPPISPIPPSRRSDADKRYGRKGGGKVYASQNKKYGGGVYPRKTVGSDD